MRRHHKIGVESIDRNKHNLNSLNAYSLQQWLRSIIRPSMPMPDHVSPPSIYGPWLLASCQNGQETHVDIEKEKVDFYTRKRRACIVPVRPRHTHARCRTRQGMDSIRRNQLRRLAALRQARGKKITNDMLLVRQVRLSLRPC